MSLAALKEHGAFSSVSEEARERIVDARVRDLAFDIRRIVGANKIVPGDAETLAQIVLDGIRQGLRVDRDTLREELLKRGRSRDKAETLSSALFK